MKTRATIIVAGDVQEVGFRAFTMKLGQKTKLTGYAENMFDGTVQIVCEGEKGIIEEYIKKLKANDGTAKIENINAKYSVALNEFKGFRVKIDDQGSEMFQGFATAGRLLTELKGEVKQVGTNVEQVGENVKTVGTKVDNLTDTVNDKFDNLDQKYHAISQEIKATNENLTKLVDNFTLLVKDYVEVKNAQK